MCGNCDSMLKIWRGIVVVCLHSYVLYTSIHKYITLKDSTVSGRYGKNWDPKILNVYLGCIITSSFAIVLELYCILQKTGHPANDGLQFKLNYSVLGNFTVCDGDQRSAKVLNEKSPQCLSRCCCCPTSMRIFLCPIHILGAFVVLLPLPWILGEQIKNEAVPSEYLWQTDLSFLFPPRPLNSQLSKYHGLEEKLVSEDRLAAASLFSLQPPALGGLGQLPQTQTQLELANQLRWNNEHGLVRPLVGAKQNLWQRTPSAEMINFFVAGLILAVDLPAVFWRVSHIYSCLSSFLIALTTVHLTIENAATSLLIQYGTCLTQPEPSPSSDQGRVAFAYKQLEFSLMLVKSPVVLPPWCILLLSAIAFIPYLVNFSLIYTFGVSCICATERALGLNIKASLGLSCQSKYSIHEPIDPTKNAVNLCSSVAYAPCCPSAHNRRLVTVSWARRNREILIAVTGILLILLVNGVKIPIQYELMRVYWENGDPLCLTSVFLGGFSLLCWLLMWIVCAVQRRHLFDGNSTTVSWDNTFGKYVTSYSTQPGTFFTCADQPSISAGRIGLTAVVPPSVLTNEVLSAYFNHPVEIQNDNSNMNSSLSRDESDKALLSCPNSFPTHINIADHINGRCSVPLDPKTFLIAPSESNVVSRYAGSLDQMRSRAVDRQEGNKNRTGKCDFNPFSDAEENAFVNGNGLVVKDYSSRSSICGQQHYNRRPSYDLPTSIATTANRKPCPEEDENFHDDVRCRHSDMDNHPYASVSKQSRPSFVHKSSTNGDHSDSSESGSKLNENQACLASIRSYQYNLSVLEAPVSNDYPTMDPDCSMPVSIPPPMQSVPTTTFTGSTSSDRATYFNPNSSRWDGLEIVVDGSSPHELSAVNSTEPLDPNVSLFESNLCSQV
ncbi:unnamed protein product [Calicophoron daubneyi]|uniref:Uncharacterized protein n=1 Tax=Calicophoron daubneyi TaxID=300641 RepID=A0AAV2T723_CALDB